MVTRNKWIFECSKRDERMDRWSMATTWDVMLKPLYLMDKHTHARSIPYTRTSICFARSSRSSPFYDRSVLAFFFLHTPIVRSIHAPEHGHRRKKKHEQTHSTLMRNISKSKLSCHRSIFIFFLYLCCYWLLFDRPHYLPLRAWHFISVVLMPFVSTFLVFCSRLFWPAVLWPALLVVCVCER